MLRRCRPQCSDVFSSATIGPIKAKHLVGHRLKGGINFCINGLGVCHMTKMAAMAIKSKNL